jgi:hypothetical protein
VLFSDMAQSLGRTYQQEITQHSSQLRSHFSQHPELEISMLLQARREALTAEQTSLTDVVRTGLIETAVAEELAVEVTNRKAVLDLLEERWETDPAPTFDRGAGDER